MDTRYFNRLKFVSEVEGVDSLSTLFLRRVGLSYIHFSCRRAIYSYILQRAAEILKLLSSTVEFIQL